MTLAILFAVLATIFLLSTFMAEPYLKEKITERANSFLPENAEFTIEDIDVGILSRGVSLYGISLERRDEDSEEEREGVRGSYIEYINASGIDLWNLFTDGDIVVGEIEVEGADLHFDPDRVADLVQADSSGGESRPVIVEALRISNGNVYLYKPGLPEAQSELQGIAVTAGNIKSGVESGEDKYLPDDFDIQVETVLHRTSNGLYEADAGDLQFSLREQTLHIETFDLTPRLSPREMPEELGHQIDHIEVNSGPVTLSGLSATEWFSDNRIVAKMLVLDSLRIDVSRDKNFPEKPKSEKPLLNSAFANVPYSVELDSLLWQTGRISYRELEEDQEEYGQVVFDDVDITGSGFQNRDPETSFRIVASSRLMGQSDLSVTFDFWPDEAGNQEIRGELSEIDLTELNSVLEPLAFIRIEEGQLQSLTFDFRLDHTTSDGELVALYDNFKIRVLDKESLDENTLNNIASFFTNQIQIRSSNEGDDPRTGSIGFEKEEGQSTFNYWWKSLRGGIRDTIERI